MRATRWIGTAAVFSTCAVSCSSSRAAKQNTEPTALPDGGPNAHRDANVDPGSHASTLEGGLFDPEGPVDDTRADAAACAKQTVRGEAIPLDMYVMLDKSASMLEPTSTGVTKWDSVRVALERFVMDSRSEGLGIGLQYFPLLKPGVPATCTSHAECGVGAPCYLSACLTEQTLVTCTNDDDCGGVADSCVEFGLCEFFTVGSAPIACTPIGSACEPGFGDCLDFPDRWCTNGTECVAPPYAKPDVAITSLPSGAAALVESVRATAPEGRTPTAPALEGAVDHARSWAAAHPGHRVIAVMATDGLPTECDTTDIDSVAALATGGVRGTPSISTFVIGVFGAEDVDSPANLDRIASAGGTERAFIVSANGDVATEFLAALDAIRGAASLSCELQLPSSDDTDGLLDYFSVNLELEDAAGDKTPFAYVESEAGCGDSTDGWYYDKDPLVDEPTKIVVCPRACDRLETSLNANINLKIGCKTVIR